MLSVITVALGFLTTQTARDVVILTDSSAAVLQLAPPATSDPTTSLALRHVTVLVWRHQNIGIQ